MLDRRRLTEHVNLSTLRLEVRRALQPVAILAVGFLAAVAAGLFILNNINGGIGSTRTMRFEVADATGVVPGRAEVRFYGIQAGQITDVQLQHGHAVLTATVADKFGPVYRNAIAEVRPNTALQDMYLDVVSRGTPSAGMTGSGYVVPLSQTQSPVNLADVLDTFQPDVRTQLNNLLDQFGNGLQDRGADLRQGFITLAPFLQIAGKVSAQLAARAQLTKDLVHNTAVLSTVLASRSTQLHQLITSGTATLEALSTEGGAPLQELIHSVPPLLNAAQPALQNVESLTPNLDRAVTALEPVADRLPSGLANLRTLARSATPAVRRLDPAVTQLLPLADRLQPFSNDLGGALNEISPQISDVNTVTQDAADCIPWIDEFFNWDASISKFSDSLGPMPRGNAHFGFYSVTPVKEPNYTYGYQCAGGKPILGVPTPKYAGPPPAP
jgi:ABC-type transporter Mla subunit MlaD